MERAPELHFATLWAVRVSSTLNCKFFFTSVHGSRNQSTDTDTGAGQPMLSTYFSGRISTKRMKFLYTADFHINRRKFITFLIIIS